MSYQALLKKILKSTRTGYAVFDEAMSLLELDFNAFSDLEIISGSGKELTPWELFAELIGFEEQIREVLAGKKRVLTIDHINKPQKSGALRYYNLTLSSFREKGTMVTRLFVLLEDVTELMAKEQQLRQEKYESLMLKTRLQHELRHQGNEILGESAEIARVRQLVERVALHSTTILLQGESGTGKSLVARAIHKASSARTMPFVEINCAAIPATLLESELFGYEKGAFTNALSEKKGLIEEADRGTLFLDEIGELPMELQAKLLTFLETRSFRRLGSTESRTVTTRLIAASNKDLNAAVRNREFREDLYYRINVVSIDLPPLRALGDDIAVLARHFVSLLNVEMKVHVKDISDNAAAKLKAYSWPGNVRELRNVIERAMIFCNKTELGTEDLGIPMSIPNDTMLGTSIPRIPEEGLSLEDLEKDLLIQSLTKTRGNQSRSARMLGLTLDTFRYRLKKFNIVPGTFR